MYGFNAFGWGEQFFSASSAQLPFRQRKRYYGSQYDGPVDGTNDVFTRKTNVGFQVNTVTKTVDFVLL